MNTVWANTHSMGTNDLGQSAGRLRLDLDNVEVLLDCNGRAIGTLEDARLWPRRPCGHCEADVRQVIANACVDHLESDFCMHGAENLVRAHSGAKLNQALPQYLANLILIHIASMDSLNQKRASMS